MSEVRKEPICTGGNISLMIQYRETYRGNLNAEPIHITVGLKRYTGAQVPGGVCESKHGIST